MTRPQTTRVRRFKPGQQAQDTVACIEIISGLRAGERIVLEPGRSRLGRADDLELTFDEDGISRVHAELFCDEDRIVTLSDRDSTNGTFVNGARVRRMALREGDRVHVGSQVQLRLVYRSTSELSDGRVPKSPEDSPLTSREQQVAALVAEGYSNDGVAAHLSISARTVGKHLSNIYQKLGIHTRAELTRWMLTR